jgi:transposase
VAQSFVQVCFEQEAHAQLKERGYQVAETQPLETPEYLGIDEFARRKGHRYDTLLADVQAKQVLAIGSGRKLEEVQKLLERLKDPEKVKAVSMDMSASYRPAVQLCLPKAQIVVDHFHVIQHVMKGFRKVLSSWAHKSESKALLEGKQHLFLRAKEDLTHEEEQDRQKIAEKIPQLGQAWRLKESLRAWYAKATVETARVELDQWITQVKASGLDPLCKTLSAFKNWKDEILAFFQFHISNGFVEGKNNRTKTIMRQGYGFSNREHLRLRIFLGELA